MPNLAKRLCEAWGGATVANVAPELQLWSPSYRELLNPTTLSRPVAVLLQCSWAESRVQAGPSNRVSSAMVNEYRSAINAGWQLELFRFVLVGEQGEGSIPELSSIALPDLLDVVHAQRKGTISTETLAMLRETKSPYCDEPMAAPLADTLMGLRNEHFPAQHSLPVPPERDHVPAYFGHYPTPLAITTPC